MEKVKFENGQEVVDKISDFMGIITAICVYGDGNIKYLVTGKSINGKAPEEDWIDEIRLYREVE